MMFEDYFLQAAATTSKINHYAIDDAYKLARDCKTLYIFGNGGSAAIANHWVCDFAKGINEDTNRGATAISLSSNIPLITAIANDIGYEFIFSKQLEYMKPTKNDVVFAISSSGNSKNIINGINTAMKLGMYTVAFTGFTGGEAAKLADTSVHIPANNYGIVEDLHMMILHYISQRIRTEFAKDLNSIKL